MHARPSLSITTNEVSQFIRAYHQKNKRRFDFFRQSSPEIKALEKYLSTLQTKIINTPKELYYLAKLLLDLELKDDFQHAPHTFEQKGSFLDLDRQMPIIVLHTQNFIKTIFGNVLAEGLRLLYRERFYEFYHPKQPYKVLHIDCEKPLSPFTFTSFNQLLKTPDESVLKLAALMAKINVNVATVCALLPDAYDHEYIDYLNCYMDAVAGDRLSLRSYRNSHARIMNSIPNPIYVKETIYGLFWLTKAGILTVDNVNILFEYAKQMQILTQLKVEKDYPTEDVGKQQNQAIFYRHYLNIFKEQIRSSLSITRPLIRSKSF